MRVPELVIVSGGQSGVDQAALDVGMKRGIRYCGWCPRNGFATNFKEKPGVLAKYPNLRETPLLDVRQRTSWNVRDSHASLLIAPEKSQGTDFAGECAEFVFQRPFHIVQGLPAAQDKAVEAAAHWLTTLIRTLGLDPFMLNIGGPREPEWEGIHDIAQSFIDRIVDLIFSQGIATAEIQ